MEKKKRPSFGRRLEVHDSKYNFKTIVISHDIMDIAKKHGLVEKQPRDPAEVIPFPTKSEGDGE